MSDELKVLSARAVKSAVSALAQDFMRAHRCVVVCDFAPVGGIERKLANGERADVIILSQAAMDRLDRAGCLVANSRRDLGRTRIGVAVRAGAPMPDLASPESFERLLLSSRKIALSDPSVGGTAALYLPTLFARMGIADALAPKLVPCTGGDDVGERVARGEADIGITFISELLAVGGVTVAGALPPSYGNDTVYSAGVMSLTENGNLVSILIAALVDPAVHAVWRRAGFEPVPVGSER
jgi:molybdate transport system substrate-binding protein